MRESLNMNFNWRFHEGDDVQVNYESIHRDRFDRPQWLKAGNMGVALPDYPDNEWETVQLPHDFILRRGDFRAEHNVVNGSLGTGVGWYRRTFDLTPQERDRRIHIEFDGVMRDSQIWINGHLVDRILSGYSSESFDVTEYCRFGERNAIAVRCSAMEPELWSYEGGGIYRNVRMVKTASIFVPAWGTYVRSELGSDGAATVAITTELCNEESETEVTVINRCIAPDGAMVVETERTACLSSLETTEVHQSLTVPNPYLWSLDDPQLYTMESEVRDASGTVLDTYRTTFGIRTIRFDPEHGFFLNGEALKIKGVCCHQDHAGVGAGVPDALQEWRIMRLKEMGCNGYRASHNPASPALLDACDRLGMLVMDENRLLGTAPEYKGQLANLIRRGRNHPSVILWSLGNEEMNVQHTEQGIRIMKKMQDLVHKMDPTRPVTYAMNTNWIAVVDEHERLGFELDVFGANYTCLCRDDVYDEFHQKYPNRCFLGSETGGSASTRGLYEEEYTPEPAQISPFNERVLVWGNPKRKGIVSAYSETFTAWGRSIADTWKDCADRPHVAGTFLWTGFDYRGETFPYLFPSVITRYGIMDLCGLPKDAFYYYRAWWRNEPMVHLLPHWDWQGQEGEPIDVWCYGNTARVELQLNGESIGGVREMERNGYLTWEVPYAPGELKAIGYSEDGTVTAQTVVRTSGPAHHLVATADRATIQADGEDVLPVTVAVVDADNQVLPRSDVPVFFSTEGAVRILGVGNGNPISHESDISDRRRCYHGLCQVLIQSTGDEGTATVTARSPGIGKATRVVTLEGGPRLLPLSASVAHGASEPEGSRSMVDEGL